MFKTVAIEESTWAVVRTDPTQPRLLEVVATFFDEARARDYADVQNGQRAKRKEEAAPARREVAKRNGAEGEADLSQRQNAVLKALRARMDENNEVAVKAAVLAEAAQIPLGSLHSVLGSLEKKRLIQSTRQGSARSPAVYQVL